MTMRRRYPALLAALLTVAAIAALLSWMGSQFLEALNPDYSDSIKRFHQGIIELEGVEGVTEQYCRQGDLVTGLNCFVRVQARDGLSDAEQGTLATSIGEVLASEADNSLRLMAELHVAGLIVGLSSTPELNAQRLEIARDLDALAPDDLVAVMWRTENDNLISDTTNDWLELTVWSSTAADPVGLYDSFAAFAAESVPYGVLTATVRTPGGVMPDNLYEWAANSIARADWRTVAATPGELTDVDRVIAATISTTAGVRGYSVEPEQVEVVAESEQLRPSVENALAELLPRTEERRLFVTYLNGGGGLG